MKLTLEGARRSCGFTQKEMSKILSMNERTYINKEKENGLFRLNELLQIKDTLSLSPDNIIEIFFRDKEE